MVFILIDIVKFILKDKIIDWDVNVVVYVEEKFVVIFSVVRLNR